MIEYADDERLSLAEYVEFVSRTDLAGEYPRKDFHARVRRVLDGADVCVTARRDGELVGVTIALTDFAYFLFLTDMAVDRRLVRRGIGREMLERAVTKGGGYADLCTVTWASKAAMPFYEASGWSPRERVVARAASAWDYFAIDDPQALLAEE